MCNRRECRKGRQVEGEDGLRCGGITSRSDGFAREKCQAREEEQVVESVGQR